MRVRRLLLVAINYWPELTGIGKYTGEMAEWLVQQGVEVRVITAPPYYPAWSVDAGYSSWRYRREQMAGVDIVRCPLWVPARPTGLKRIIHLASFALTAFPVMLWSGLRWRPDSIFVVEPPLFCAPAALLTARLAGGEAWLHVQDLEVDAAFELGILRAGWLRRWVLAAERWLMRRFDRVTTISQQMLKRLLQKGVAYDCAHLFPNWVDTDHIYPTKPSMNMRQELGIGSETSVLLYSGNMGEKQGLEILLDAAESMLSVENVVFVLCGDGAAKNKLEASARAQKLSNVMFIPLQPIHRFNELLNLADIHMLPQRPGAEDLVMPSKLTAMLASGKPVIAIARQGSQVASVVEKCGVVIESADASRLREAIQYLLDAPLERQRLGDHGRKYALDYWSKESVLQKTFSAGL
jgi:colanic acid biosynthesis glycosyl transferase WcaI